MACAAQTARAPGTPASAVVRAGAAAAGDAGRLAGDSMERAQRAADSPLRAILEAAKVRRRAEADPPTESEVAARRAAAQRAAGAESGRADLAPRSVVAGAAPVPGNGGAGIGNGVGNGVGHGGGDGNGHRTGHGNGAVASVPGDAASGTAEPDSAIVTIRTLPNEPVAAAPARSASLEPAAIAPLGSPLPPAGRDELPRPLPPSGELALRPELLHMVEPVVTPRLLEQLTRPDVTVEFIIQKDGRVSGVQVLPPVPRPLVQFVIEAVEQWRFAPLPEARPHRVQLVFKAGR